MNRKKPTIKLRKNGIDTYRESLIYVYCGKYSDLQTAAFLTACGGNKINKKKSLF